jgi:hypothetical protein
MFLDVITPVAALEDPAPVVEELAPSVEPLRGPVPEPAGA